MSDDHMESAAATLRNVAAYQGPAAESTPEIRGPARSVQLRRMANEVVRHCYGWYNLASAPREALVLNAARRSTALARLISEAGRKGALASQPFVCAKWDSASRLRRMIDHCAVVDKLGHPFDITSDQYIEIVKFDLDGERCRFMLDRPRWLVCDGLLCVSLWVGPDRVFSVSFCLSDNPAGRTAYIGGIQGYRSDDALEHNRVLTKAAHGMRPRDLAFELFRMILPRLGVTRLECVADEFRYQMTKRARMTVDKVQLDYNEIWQSRGGVMGANGFYSVPIEYSRREISEISVKKRSMYKKRYAMLDLLEAEIGAALRQPCVIHSHAPKFLDQRAAVAA